MQNALLLLMAIQRLILLMYPLKDQDTPLEQLILKLVEFQLEQLDQILMLL